MAADLPCDGDGVCMVCNSAPPEAEVVTCHTCTTPWHAPCLARPLPSLTSVIDWECPDCLPSAEPVGSAAALAPTSGSSELVAAIRAIEADATLTEQEKARRRQALLGGGTAAAVTEEEKARKGKGRDTDGDDMLDLIDEKFKCAFCMQLPERPVTTPCGHNFCLRCFQKWIGQGKHSCVQCRAAIPSKMASQPRINSTLVQAIRMARTAKSSMSSGVTQVYHFMRNEDRPDTAFTTERAKRAGKANACSGQIFVTVPPDHFGPILAENDPKRNQGVLVGEIWEDRMECRQWGAHFPHVAGIAGQSDYGAQSVALSGGYEDDEDHGEWFLYTGSGGRDLSGNKRTNKEQAFDQKFEKLNEALRVSCKKGYPVRVVRSHKEKRSSYAPESGVRYDGIYRIEKCWRKVGTQGFKVCRYLFIRCDNSPAPWTSDEHGDRVRPLPDIKELKAATDITIRKDSPAWDYDEERGWRWTRDPPVSRKQVHTADPQERERARKAIRRAHKHSIKERLKKEFGCLVCRNVMTSPLTTPCGHNFCKPCLLGSYADQSFVRERICEGGRSLRSQKIVKKCPSCMADITDFLQNPQVNRELNDLVETLKRKCEEEEAEQLNEEGSEEVKSSVDNCDCLEEKTASENGDIVSQQKPSMEGSSSPKGAEITLEESNARVQETLDTTKGISVVKSENVGIGEEGKKNGQNLVIISSPQSSRKRQNTPVGRSCKKAKNHNDMNQKFEINENDAKLEDEDGQRQKPVGRPRKNSNKGGDEGELQKKPVGRPRRNAKKDEDEGQVQKKPAGRPLKKAKKTDEGSTEMDQKSNGELVDSELKDSVSSVGNLAISEKVGGQDDAQNQMGSSKKVTPKKIREGRKLKNVEAADEDFQ